MKEKLLKNKKIVVSLVLIVSLLMTSVFYAGFVSGQSSAAFTLSPGIYPSSGDVSVYTEGDTYYAKNNYGFTVFSGSDGKAVINYALSTLPSDRLVPAKLVLHGDIHVTGTINVPSFTTIQIEGTVFLENNANTNVFSVSNGYFVTIEGGGINANKAGQSYNSNAIAISNSRIVSINNIFIANAYLAGVYAYNTNSSQVSNCNFKDCGLNVAEKSGSIYWDGGQHNSITNNLFKDGSFAEVMCADWLLPINDFTISNNEMIDSFFGVVYCGNFGTITGNTLHARAPCDAGIYINGRGNQGDLCTVSGNTIAGHMDGIGLEDSYNCAVSGNTIFATWGGHGIFVFGATYSTNNTIIGNTMFNIAKNGIYLVNASFNLVNSNTITGSNAAVLDGTFCAINATTNAFSNLYVGDYADKSGMIISDINSHVANCWNGSSYVVNSP